MNGKTPLLLSVLLAAVLAVALLYVQPYSYRAGPPSPWRGYAEPAQRYLKAAVRMDSLALVRQSATAQPVERILVLARDQPDSLALWAREAAVWTGSRHGDTTEILLQQPLWFRFVGSGRDVKVAEVGRNETREVGMRGLLEDDSLLP